MSYSPVPATLASGAAECPECAEVTQVGANEAEPADAAIVGEPPVTAESVPAPDAPQPAAPVASPAPLPDALTASTAFLLRQSARRAAVCLSDALEPLSLHTRHYGILLALAEDGPSSQSSLGKRLGIDRTTMVSSVDELEKLGYLARKPDPIDRRANRVELTGRGRGRLVRATGAIATAEAQLLAGLTTDEVRTLRSLLRRVTHGADE
jgi:DNA-binding MarR family transcriptional regulator